jgi:hypothetical protein
MPAIPDSRPDAGNGPPRWLADIVFDLYDFRSTVKAVEAGRCEEGHRAAVFDGDVSRAALRRMNCRLA